MGVAFGSGTEGSPSTNDIEKAEILMFFFADHTRPDTVDKRLSDFAP